MDTNDSPLALYFRWFDELPPPVRTTVAWMVSAAFPNQAFIDLCNADSPGDSASAFKSLALEISDTALAEGGLAMTLSALTEFSLVGYRTREDWNDAEGRNQRLAEIASQRGKPNLASMLEKNIEEMELRARMWIRASQSWDELRATGLSTQRIHDWVKTEADKQARLQANGNPLNA